MDHITSPRFANGTFRGLRIQTKLFNEAWNMRPTPHKVLGSQDHLNFKSSGAQVPRTVEVSLWSLPRVCPQSLSTGSGRSWNRDAKRKPLHSELHDVVCGSTALFWVQACGTCTNGSKRAAVRFPGCTTAESMAQQDCSAAFERSQDFSPCVEVRPSQAGGKQVSQVLVGLEHRLLQRGSWVQAGTPHNPVSEPITMLTSVLCQPAVTQQRSSHSSGTASVLFLIDS